MQRIESLSRESATEKARELMDAVEEKLGMVPNVLRVMANSPATLGAYIGVEGALSEGILSAGLRQKIALVVAESDGCDYCLAAHTAFGRMVGLSVREIDEARRGAAEDTREAAALAFARKVAAEHGRASEESLAAARAAGLTDGEIVEIVANVALTIFTDSVNHVAGTEIDFPEVGPVT